ncbi:MAG: hypothetical protein ACYDCC_05715 [Actinomycetota bacterium]
MRRLVALIALFGLLIPGAPSRANTAPLLTHRGSLQPAPMTP